MIYFQEYLAGNNHLIAGQIYLLKSRTVIFPIFVLIVSQKEGPYI
ncbi:hypothetical protein SAMN05518672_10341 [Chitinophaga sp. CF118]|nr:hypothetical protein SAMN05518672_10341 [Chitinophaga sp. CF118]